MFAGASLNPSYFKEKVNLFVALAPVGRTTNISSAMLPGLAPKWKLIQFGAERTHAYNLLGVNWWASEAELLFCGEFEGICEHLL